MKARILSTILATAMLGLVTPSFATLVGVRPSYPLIVYANASGNVSNLTYNATTKLFYISNSSPSSIQFTSTEGVKLITGAKSLSIQALVDNSGTLIGGVAGDDLVLSGTVTRGTDTYTGVLLTGEVTAFGFLESGATDQYDFRFTPTGGALYSFFACGDIAVTVTSENSTFANSFSVSFRGKAKGSVGLEDLIAPVCTCPPDMTVESQAFANGLPGAYVSFPMPTVTDNCDTNPTITCTPPSGSFFPLPPTGPSTNYTVTCVAQDAAGNTCTCSFVITVQDTLPPEFADTNNPVIYDDLTHPIDLCNDAGQSYATFAFMQPVATDNAISGTFPANVSAIDENGAIIPLTDLGNGSLQGQFPVDISGSNVITVTADDGRGNTTQHQVAIFVADCEPPSIICPTNQFVECTNGPVFFEEPLVSDNCPGVTFTLTPTNGSILPGGVNPIFALATDRSGNTNQCTFSVTVQDTTPPVISCPANVTVECGQPTTPSSTGMATATDTCDSSPQLSFADATSGACPQTITRTWKATDSSGNTASCVQIITVQDTTAPVLTCPPDKQLQCADSTLPANTGTATATDACSTNVAITYTDAATPANCTGKTGIDRAWKATDGCGNSSTAVQHITFVDTTAPVMTCPPDKQLQCGDSTLPANTGTATATDNCSASVAITYTDAATPANCTGKPGIARTWKATDGCGNSSTAVQNITFVDTTPPVLACPLPITVPCASAVPVPDPTTVTATDNCGGALTVTFAGDVTNNLTCPNKFLITRTYQAVDACGNSNSCIQTITVNDTAGPVITGCVNQAVTFKPIATNCSCKFDFPFDGNKICKGRYIWFTCALQIPSSDNGPCTVRVRQQTIQFACGNSNITLTVPDADVTFSNGAPCSTTFTNGAWATMTPWGLDGNTFCAGLAWQAPCDISGGVDPTWSATFSVDNINVAVNWQAAAAVYTSFSSNHSLLGVKPTDDSQACSYKNSDYAGSPQCFKPYVTCGGRSGDCNGFRYTGCHNPYSSCNIQKGVVKKGPVNYTMPTVSDACGGIAKIICSPPVGTILGPGVTTVNCTAYDACGNTNTCSFKLTVLSPCQVVFDSPADDGQQDNHAGWDSGFDDWNCPDDPDTTEDFNLFRSGDKVLHTVRLLDCTGADVTDSLASSVTVHIDVTERQGDYATSTLLTDVPQNYVSVGSPGSIMVYTSHHFEYNLDTTGYQSGTINTTKSFRSCVWVEYKTAPGVCAGIEDIVLESQ